MLACALALDDVEMNFALA